MASRFKNGMDTQKQSPDSGTQPPAQLVRVVGVIKSCFQGNVPSTVQGQDGLVHGNHTLAAAGIQGVVDLMGFSVPDETADGGVHVHDLVGGHQTAVFVRQQLLRHHGAEHHGQLDPLLGLLGAGEGVDDAVDGVGGPLGVQGSPHHMARLGGSHGGVDGLFIPHFAQKDDVWGLAQAGPQSR